MKMIYISHPYTGDEENNRDEAIALATVLAKAHPDILFVNPLAALYHTALAELDYDTVIDQCKELLCCCEGLILTGDWQNSKGCQLEYDFAKSVKLPIWQSIAAFEAACEKGLPSTKAQASDVCSVYPRPCINASERYVYQWVRKLKEELGEAIEAIYTDRRPQEVLNAVPLSRHAAEELTDLITVATSLLDAGGYTFEDRQAIQDWVNTKNRDRGYW